MLTELAKERLYWDPTLELEHVDVTCGEDGVDLGAHLGQPAHLIEDEGVSECESDGVVAD